MHAIDDHTIMFRTAHFSTCPNLDYYYNNKNKEIATQDYNCNIMSVEIINLNNIKIQMNIVFYWKSYKTRKMSEHTSRARNPLAACPTPATSFLCATNDVYAATFAR